MPEIFSKKVEKEKKRELKKKERLFNKIGNLNIKNEFLKKVRTVVRKKTAKGFIEYGNKNISVRHQCKLFGINRSSLYCKKVADDQTLEKEILAIYKDRTFYGYRRMTVELLRNFQKKVNKKRVLRTMQKLGICAIYPRSNLSKAIKAHKKYPYLLKNMEIERLN